MNKIISNTTFIDKKYKEIYKSKCDSLFYINPESLESVKNYLIKNNIKNTYILDDVSYLQLLKEIALSNNKLIIVDTGNITDIHKKLANKIITIEDLKRESF